MGRLRVEAGGPSFFIHAYRAEPYLNARGIERHAAAPGGGEDASPVRVGAGPRRLHQRRCRDGLRHLTSFPFRAPALDVQAYDVLHAFTVRNDLLAERLADFA